MTEQIFEVKKQRRYKDFKSFKILIYVILSLFIAFCSTMTFILSDIGKQNSQYTISFNSNKNKDINDIYISNIYINNSDVKLYHFDKNIETINDKEMINLSNNKKISFETSKIDNIRIIFKTHDKNECNNLQINNNITKICSNNYYSSYQIENRLSTLLMDYIDENLIISVVTFIVSFVIALGCVYYLGNFFTNIFTNISNKKINILNVFIFLLCIFAICFMSIYLLLYLFKMYFIAVIAIILGIFIYKKREIFKEKIECVFIILATIFGILMIFIIPPFNIPDETSHYLKSYESSIFIDTSVEEIKGKYYMYLPESLENFYIKYGENTLTYNYKFSGRTYFSDLLRPMDFDNKSEDIRYYSTYNASKFAYMPSSFSIGIAKIFNLSPLISLLLARFTNFAIWVLLTNLAIKITPKFKKTFLLISLFPISIQQAIGINQDYLNNCIFFLLAALLFKEIFSDEKYISKLKIFLICSLSIMLLLCKIIYIPILLLLFLIPNDKFKSKKEKIIIKYIIPILLVILSFVLYKMVTPSSPALNGTNPNPNNFYLISDMIRNPKLFFDICVNTLTDRLSLDVLRGMFDGFGWSTIWIKETFRDLIMIFYIIFILMLDSDRHKISKKELTIYSIIFILIFGLIYAAMLFAWTKNYMNFIDGLQPRYFIPCILFLYILLSQLNLKIPKVKNYYPLMYIGIIAILFICNASILYNFYI